MRLQNKGSASSRRRRRGWGGLARCALRGGRGGRRVDIDQAGVDAVVGNYCGGAGRSASSAICAPMPLPATSCGAPPTPLAGSILCGIMSAIPARPRSRASTWPISSSRSTSTCAPSLVTTEQRSRNFAPRQRCAAVHRLDLGPRRLGVQPSFIRWRNSASSGQCARWRSASRRRISGSTQCAPALSTHRCCGSLSPAPDQQAGGRGQGGAGQQRAQQIRCAAPETEKSPTPRCSSCPTKHPSCRVQPCQSTAPRRRKAGCYRASRRTGRRGCLLSGGGVAAAVGEARARLGDRGELVRHQVAPAR